MMLIEQTPVPDGALPVAEFKDHLQLGSGFADDGLQDPVLVSQVRAAMLAVEAETGKILSPRTFQYVVTAWRDVARQALPVAPVTAVTGLTITDLSDTGEVIDPAAYRLVRDTHRPEVVAVGWALPTIPVGGTAEFVFEAGYGPAWANVPADLRQAVLMLAAHYYDNRSASTEKGHALPMGVQALCARHKPVRIFGGGRR